MISMLELENKLQFLDLRKACFLGVRTIMLKIIQSTSHVKKCSALILYKK